MKKNKESNKGSYHLLMFVQKSEPCIKRFYSAKKLGEYVDKFLKKYPDYASVGADNWIDYCIMDINGPIHFFTDGLKVK